MGFPFLPSQFSQIRIHATPLFTNRHLPGPYRSRAYADLENTVGSLIHTCSLKKGEALSLGKWDANSCFPLLLLLLL